MDDFTCSRRALFALPPINRSPNHDSAFDLSSEQLATSSSLCDSESFYSTDESDGGRYLECSPKSDDLKDSTVRQNPDRLHKCPLESCEYHIKGFARKYKSKRHLLTHYTGTLICYLCNGSSPTTERHYENADVFKRHLVKIHGVTSCPATERAIDKHRSGHKAHQPRNSSGKDLRSLMSKCSVCSNDFGNAQILYDHLDECIETAIMDPTPASTRISRQPENSIYTADDKPKQHRLSTEVRQFLWYFRNEGSALVPRLERKLFVCRHCKEKFPEKHELRKHSEFCYRFGRKVYVCVDPSDGLRLQGCEYCRASRHYYSRNDAIAHLHQVHFNPQNEINSTNSKGDHVSIGSEYAPFTEDPEQWLLQVNIWQHDESGSEFESHEDNSFCAAATDTPLDRDPDTMESRETASASDGLVELSELNTPSETEASFLTCSGGSESPILDMALNAKQQSFAFAEQLAERLVSRCLLRLSSASAQKFIASTQSPQSLQSSSVIASKQSTSNSETSRPKRRRGEEDDKERQTPDDGGEGDAPARKRVAGREHTGKLFACPYFKFDPVRYSEQNQEEIRYRTCASKYLVSTSRLKQHLYRVHARPRFYCGNCFQSFDKREKSDQHDKKKPRCEEQMPRYEERMTDDQYAYVKRRKLKDNPYDTWYEIFACLFPGATKPRSPYMSTNDPVVLGHFIGFFRSYGAEELFSLMREYHERNESFQIALPTRSIVEEAFELALPDYQERLQRMQWQYNTEPGIASQNYQDASLDPNLQVTASIYNPEAAIGIPVTVDGGMSGLDLLDIQANTDLFNPLEVESEFDRYDESYFRAF